MKNSFFLVIPSQQTHPGRLKEFETKILQQWLTELPTANLGLTARLIHDFITSFNTIKMPVQLRLEALELLKPNFTIIESHLRSKLIRTGFPKEDNDKKILRLLISLEKEFTISYWIALKELTEHEVGWFQGKNVALALQRTIKGLGGIVVSYLMMGMPIPHWVWMDLHSLYKFSVILKKDTTQVANDGPTAKASSPATCYLQVILLNLADPTGLMQKEIPLVYNFIETLAALVSLRIQPVANQPIQCVIRMDEDKPPYFQEDSDEAKPDSLVLYLDFIKLHQAFAEKKESMGSGDARFGALQVLRDISNKPTVELLDYLQQRWSGADLQGAPLFSDRLDRYLAIGLSPTFNLQDTSASGDEKDLEIRVQSVSSRLLSCIFKQTGVISVGSLVSFRKMDMPQHKRLLGIVDKLIVGKEDGQLGFGVQLLTHQSIAVTYLPLESPTKEPPKKALLYSVKEQEGRSYIIIDTFILKEGSAIRLLVKQEDIPILLKNKKNIGLGYWQFECIKLAEKRE